MRLVGSLLFFTLAGCASSSSQCTAGACLDAAAHPSDAAVADAVPDVSVVDDAPAAPQFVAGHIYVSASRNAQIWEYALAADTHSLITVSSWTHPSFYPDYAHFEDVPGPVGQPPDSGPAGIAFDLAGNLVVAGRDQLCVFSAPGTVERCVDKHVPGERTGALMADGAGNLYTTGTAAPTEITVYGPDLSYQQTIAFAAGGAAGIACDAAHNLYVVSQKTTSPYTSNIYTLLWQSADGGDGGYATAATKIPVKGLVETLVRGANSLVFTYHDDFTHLDGGLAVSGGIQRVSTLDGGTVVAAYGDSGGDGGLTAGLVMPIALAVDTDGNLYTADWENRLGSASADLYVFAPNGTALATRKGAEVYGPLGLAIGGTVVTCGP